MKKRHQLIKQWVRNVKHTGNLYIYIYHYSGGLEIKSVKLKNKTVDTNTKYNLTPKAYFYSQNHPT